MWWVWRIFLCAALAVIEEHGGGTLGGGPAAVDADGKRAEVRHIPEDDRREDAGWVGT
jgi:hypothetical protein